MASQTLSFQLISSSSNWVPRNSSQRSSLSAFGANPHHSKPSNLSLRVHGVRRSKMVGATLDEENVTAKNPLPNKEVLESVTVLKKAAKSRNVPKEEILSALAVIEKAKLDPSEFLKTLGGSESPGRTWMLVFTAEKQYNGGRFFPLTVIQRFDAVGKRIENGVYLGPIGALTFEGRFSWKNRILAFIFECVRIKVGSLKPLEISLGEKDEREPSTKDPFFIWFYIDEPGAKAAGPLSGVGVNV